MTTVRKKSGAAGRGEPSTEPWLTIRQAARLLGIAYGTVLAKASRGELETQTVAGRLFVSRASVERHTAPAGAR